MSTIGASFGALDFDGLRSPNPFVTHVYYTWRQQVHARAERAGTRRYQQRLKR